MVVRACRAAVFCLSGRAGCALIIRPVLALTFGLAIAMALGLAASCSHSRSVRPPGDARAPSGPVIQISSDLWDFGTLERGRTASSEIKVGNSGDDSLRVLVRSTCDCLTASLASPVVPPGGSSAIALTYQGYEITDASSKTLYVDSNDPVRSRLTVTVRGKIVEGRSPHLVALPSPLPLKRSAAPAGDVAGGEPGGARFEQAALTITNRGREDLSITEVRCFGCTTDWGGWAGTVLERGEEAVLRVDALPGWSSGRWIEIQSNDPVWPVKRISLVEMD